MKVLVIKARIPKDMEMLNWDYDKLKFQYDVLLTAYRFDTKERDPYVGITSPEEPRVPIIILDTPLEFAGIRTDLTEGIIWAVQNRLEIMLETTVPASDYHLKLIAMYVEKRTKDIMSLASSKRH